MPYDKTLPDAAAVAADIELGQVLRIAAAMILMFIGGNVCMLSLVNFGIIIPAICR